MSNPPTSQASALIQPFSVENPVLYNALQAILGQVDQLNATVFPTTSGASTAAVAETLPLVPMSFTYELNSTFVRFLFTPTSGDEHVRLYEVRLGSVWETASLVVRTASTQADINPIAVGTTRYLVKTINSGNLYSTDSLALDVTVPAIGAITISPVVIDNNVLLYLIAPTSTFLIDHYNLYKNSSLTGRTTSTFITFFETSAGVYTYGVEAVDIAGNVSARYTIDVTVNRPPDFELQASITSLLDGVKVNLVDMERDEPTLLCCVDTAQTWQTHFTTGIQAGKPWSTPQAQVDNGYPYYIQPTTNGSYQEVFDFGAEFNNTILNVSMQLTIIAGTSFTIGYSLESSLDGVTWAAPILSSSGFFQSIRYVRLTITFTPASDTTFAELTNLQVVLDVKREIDSGEVLALFDDADGTVGFFNKTFKDIDSLTLGCETKTPLTVVKIFEDVPNPTFFKVMVFDTAGIRVTKSISWKARGIV